MSYCSRVTGRQYRHDPARYGIFIHGGTNQRPKWEAPDSPERRYTANRFSLSLPTCTPTLKDTDARMIEIRESVRSLTEQPQPTFFRAVKAARDLRRLVPELAECGIYACTDFVHAPREAFMPKGKRTCTGRSAVQLIAPPTRVTPHR